MSDDRIADLEAKVKDYEFALDQKNRYQAITFRLSPVLNNILGLLMSLPNVSAEMIRQRLQIASDAKVSMHRLRKHLRPYGIEVESRRTLGYWLERETKDKVRALVAKSAAEMKVAEIDKVECNVT